MIAGTENGLIRSMQYPITPGEMKDFVGHEGRVTRLRITHDDFYLFTTGEDGCVIIFEIKEKEGRIDNKRRIGGVVYSSETLVTKHDLEDMEIHERELEAKRDEMALQHEFQLRLLDVQLQDRLKEMEESHHKKMKL